MKSLLLHRYRQIRRVGPAAALRLARDRGIRLLDGFYRRAVGQILPSGLRSWAEESAPRCLVPVLSLPCDGGERGWLAHRFDLLGSGPVSVALADAPWSDLPPMWRPQARALAAMLPTHYRLIDWQRDAKSGHRWSARTWHRNIAYGHLPGVDIKWPWELARLQHLPPLAARINGAGADLRELLKDELQAQIVDFVLQNPPNYGVNWVCAMDVGIRAVNIALAVDIARAGGTEFSEKFLRLVSATLRDHGRFVVGNLEWGASLCSNHYLADIVGLLFIAAYLEPDEESSRWLAFSGRELVLQLRGQFHADGTNFEASTCYHRLSSEMMAYGVALMLHFCERYPEQVEVWWSGKVASFHPPPTAPAVPTGYSASGVRVPFDLELTTRLRGMGQFTEALLRQDGSIPVIGDDDSGRFVRLGYAPDSVSDLLSHRELPDQVMALFGASSGRAESEWLCRWVGNASLPLPAAENEITGWRAFSKFGLYVIDAGSYRVSFRCGPVGQNGNGGHAHSDQLAFTLDYDRRPVIVDAGTGIYTPDPILRNQLRSVTAHNTVVIPGREPNEWLPGRWGLFAMKDLSLSRLVWCDSTVVQAEHYGYGQTVRRTLRADVQHVELFDEVPSGSDGAYAQAVLAPGVTAIVEKSRCCLKVPGAAREIVLELGQGEFLAETVPISPRYGVTVETKALRWPPGKLTVKSGA